MGHFFLKKCFLYGSTFKEKRRSFSEDKRKIGGHLRTIKKKGSFSDDFSLKKKKGSFREALNLSAKFYLATT